MFGALVGGAAAGPVGALIGGLSASQHGSSSTTGTDILSAIELSIRIRDEAQPWVRLSFKTKDTSARDRIETFVAHLANVIDARGDTSEGDNSSAQIDHQDGFLVDPTQQVLTGWWARTFLPANADTAGVSDADEQRGDTHPQGQKGGGE